jgi:four helix bundle protein
MRINSYRDLMVWQLAMALAEGVYKLVTPFPAEERFGLSLQLRRVAVSIPSNIAEGSNYGTNRQYMHHLRIALGSEGELQTQLELSERLKLAPPEEVRPLVEQASEVGRMLNGLVKSLRRADP